MRMSEPAGNKFKHVCNDLPNMAIFTKSATPENIQLMFEHASVRNKSLGESVTVFALAESIETLTVISINVDITFTIFGDKIWIPVIKILLFAAVGNLARSKNG